MKLALVGDIGGTNARFALWENDQLRAISVLATADFACPEDAIALYLQGLDLPLGAIGWRVCAEPDAGGAPLRSARSW